MGVKGKRALVFAVVVAAFAVTSMPAAADQGVADVGVAVSGPSQLEQGTSGNYLVSYTNNGPATATNVVVTVTMDPNLYWNPQTTTGPCTNVTPQGQNKQQTFVCQVGTVAPAQSGSFNFGVQAFYGTPTGTFKVTFSISADQPDNKQQNNAVPLHIAVVTPYHADVWTEVVRDYATSYPYAVGETISLDTQYGNNGPAGATNAVETFQLPASLTYDSTHSDSRCSASGQTVTCALGTVQVNGGTNELIIAFEPVADGTYTITASIRADQPDQDVVNNTSSDTIYITA